MIRSLAISIFAFGLFIAVFLFLLIACTGRRIANWENLRLSQLSTLFRSRGWLPALGLPQELFRVVDEIEGVRPILSSSSFFIAPEKFLNGDVTIFAAFTRRGAPGRGLQAYSAMSFSRELRTPLPCFIATMRHTRMMHEDYQVVALKRDCGPSLCLHFRSDVDPKDARLAASIQIVEMIFRHVRTVFDDERLALIGRNGLLLTGPVAINRQVNSEQLIPYLNDVEGLADRYPQIASLIRAHV